ncbi:MAG TPA: hypothetical protein VMN77_03950 [Nitrospiria bacterium]|jgi:hypothetical protein|nr:hypothetical protein [Nitrospiria bacterium]
MPKTSLKKEKWTLSFDPRLKRLLIKEARKKGVYPVSLLEDVVRERFNPYGHSDVKDSVAHVREIRKGSRDRSDEPFLKEIRDWQKSNS